MLQIYCRFSVFVERMENGAHKAQDAMAKTDKESGKVKSHAPEASVFNVFSWLGLSPASEVATQKF